MKQPLYFPSFSAVVDSFGVDLVPSTSHLSSYIDNGSFSVAVPWFTQPRHQYHNGKIFYWICYCRQTDRPTTKVESSSPVEIIMKKIRTRTDFRLVSSVSDRLFLLFRAVLEHMPRTTDMPTSTSHDGHASFSLARERESQIQGDPSTFTST